MSCVSSTCLTCPWHFPFSSQARRLLHADFSDIFFFFFLIFLPTVLCADFIVILFFFLIRFIDIIIIFFFFFLDFIVADFEGVKSDCFGDGRLIGEDEGEPVGDPDSAEGSADDLAVGESEGDSTVQMWEVPKEHQIARSAERAVVL